MSAYTRGRKRDQLTFVRINDVPLLYGWNAPDLAAATGISSGDLTTQLGHLTAVAAAAIAGGLMVFGANSPKPARATKKIAGAPTSSAASVSTYCSYNTRAAATGAGWRVGKQKSVRLRAAVAGRRSQTAVAELSNGLQYAFPMNIDDFTLVGSTLGLQAASQVSTTEAKKLATGMTGTRPGRASLEDSGGILRTFFSTSARDAAVAAGFSIDEEEVIAYTAAPVGP